MFNWHQRFHPDTSSPAHIAPNSLPPSIPHFHHKVPVLYPEQLPKPVPLPADSPAASSHAGPPRPPIPQTLQLPGHSQYLMPILYTHQNPDPTTHPTSPTTTAQPVTPHNCKTPPPPTHSPLYPATEPPASAAQGPPPLSLPHHHLMPPGILPHQLIPQPHSVDPADRPSTSAPLPPLPPHSHPPALPYDHLTVQQFYPPMDPSHQPVNSPSHSLPLLLPMYYPNSSLFYLHPYHPHPAPSSPAPVPLSTQPAVPQLPPFFSPQFPPILICKANEMMVTLPAAHPDSIEVKDKNDMWLPIASADPACSYALQFGELRAPALSIPLPACHTRTVSPSLIALYLRFWDMAVGRLQFLDLQCPYSPPPPTQSPPTDPSTSHKPQVFCRADHMDVTLPPGVWDVIVLGIKGDETRLQEAPEDCGYVVKMDPNGSDSASPNSASPSGPSSDSGPYYFPVHAHTEDGGESYLVQSPFQQAEGMYGVELRIATDQNYTSYYPGNHRPFRHLLGRPLFLELRVLNSPDPRLPLLVHCCLAHSGSAPANWMFIYDGCPSRLDPQHPPRPAPGQTRRLSINAFQHLPLGGRFHPDEEVGPSDIIFPLGEQVL
ncbi:hypothetical protein MATL_G00216850 [Megalops atlanticus]|uniref:ZP-C domain-containing protein n=1 Tax=Megalops atlanticus TaxID=7932 RepID=A0A9D3PKK1_MEGAT|nr:hypothetical protein MATL_G00216850 [Megalops atlanticus]